MEKIKICFISRGAYRLFNPKWLNINGSSYGGA